MTKAQENAVARIKRLAEQTLFFSEDYEFKAWEVKEYESFVSVLLETGLKGDEGTWASIIARDRAHLFIGKRGGITYPVSKNKRHYTKSFNGHTILTVVIDQR